MPFTPLNLTSVAKPTPSFKPLGYNPPQEIVPVTPPSFFERGISYVKGIPNQISTAFTSSFQQGVQGATQVGQGGGPLGGAVAGLEGSLKVGAGVAGIVFSPIAPITNIIGEAIQFAGDQLAKTPLIKSYASTAPEADYRVLEALQNLGGISMGLLGAKAGDVKLKNISPEKLNELAKHPDIVAATEKVVEAKKLAEAKPTPSYKPLNLEKTPAQLHAEYAKTQGYESYTPPDQLPTIKTGSTPKSELPAIQTEAPKSTKLGDLTIEPIKEARLSLQESFNKLNESTLTGDSATARAQLTDIQTKITDLTQKVEQAQQTPRPQTPPVTLEGKTPSGVAISIETKALEQGMTERFKEVAGYDASTIKEQARIFSETASRGVDEVRAQIRGEKPLAEGQKSAPFVVAAEQFIKQHPELNKNGELSYELANSPHTTAFSEAGSQLGLSQNRVQDSFTAKIQEIRKAREVRAGEKATKSTKTLTKSSKSAMDDVNLSKEDLGKIESFIDKITC